MPIITSPIARFPGTVTLPDGLSWDQYIAWEKALAMALKESRSEAPTLSGMQAAWLPGLRAVVEAWNLEGVTDGNIPPKPRRAVGELIDWLIEEITALYKEADEVPNE